MPSFFRSISVMKMQSRDKNQEKMESLGHGFFGIDRYDFDDSKLRLLFYQSDIWHEERIFLEKNELWA